ncbi:hypothetical protein TRAPUB_14105 [Trametes pubescens]|uniref:Uncharacterized protein n=1 Tax=Trametes pubescens TaxID=154538 RepID=A0A1M2VDC9_TRAPU|nr:hypothetical protein TRAPUB_3660 [Trametes pubescens]OJT05600.1 hypothetical protein TRAPUB_3581 [Trametes pubescens]OJT09419.1 hypothetical protein TRAPUB_14105 [Trametes pubescens]
MGAGGRGIGWNKARSAAGSGGNGNGSIAGRPRLPRFWKRRESTEVEWMIPAPQIQDIRWLSLGGNASVV